MPVAMLQCPEAGLLRFTVGLGQVHSQSEHGNTNSAVEMQGGAGSQLGHNLLSFTATSTRSRRSV